MRVGEDINLRVCLSEGYMIMDFKVRELFPGGRKYLMDKDCYVRFQRSNGYLSHDMDGNYKYPFWWRQDYPGEFFDRYALDESYTFNDLVNLYRKYEKELHRYTGNAAPNLDDPNEYDMLFLASDLDSYCGLGTS